MKSTFSPTSQPPSGSRKSLSDEVASYIREQIMSGDLRPGQYIRMERIAEAGGMSITPVREALVALSGDGFVTAVPRRGFVVEPFSRQDVRDLFWTQAQLSGELAARAAVRITEEDLAHLRILMEEGDAAVARGDDETAGLLGHRFHRAINRVADSDRLARLLASVVKHLPNHFYTSIEGNVRDAPDEHHRILAALTARDAEQARELAAAHLNAHATHVVTMLEERGLWSDEPQD